ncbi:MAG: PH domain-containing protein [Chloroflexi bacterium]|nr:PH domain-containing protein [Chloroflexota bacterium]
MKSESFDHPGATGKTLRDAEFEGGVIPYYRLLISLYFAITIVGIPLIPFWLIFSLWYAPEYHRRLSARLTSQAIEIRKGVFNRRESTIPLNRVTDLRLHDGPIMRRFKVRGLRVETAGQSGQYASSEGDLVGVVDAEEFRNAILMQRQRVLGAEPDEDAPTPATGTTELLTEIRDILARMESKE